MRSTISPEAGGGRAAAGKGAENPTASTVRNEPRGEPSRSYRGLLADGLAVVLHHPGGRETCAPYDDGRDGARLATDGPHGARESRGPVGRALTLSVKLPLLSLS